MGIDFRQGKISAHWSFNGFNDFRRKLAREIGINLDDMWGFGGKKAWDTVNDTIVPLLNHSDCDGELSPGQCKTIEPRLRELIATWPYDSYDKYMATKLADIMQQCAEKNTDLIFS